jgi:hypothetical protein
MSYLGDLKQKTKDELVNELYNDRVSSLADYTDQEETTIDKHNHGKRIPYIGWFWRATGFVTKDISIGNCGDFIGVMENNKWGYAERHMTEEEADKFIEYLERAFAERSKGGTVSETDAKSEVVFNELWDWMQTLKDTGKWSSTYSWEYRV